MYKQDEKFSGPEFQQPLELRAASFCARICELAVKDLQRFPFLSSTLSTEADRPTGEELSSLPALSLRPPGTADITRRHLIGFQVFNVPCSVVFFLFCFVFVLFFF